MNESVIILNVCDLLTEPDDTYRTISPRRNDERQPCGLTRKSLCHIFVALHPIKQILAGLPADGLVIQTDDPNLTLGNDAAVSAVDACSGLEVEVVSLSPNVLRGMPYCI